MDPSEAAGIHTTLVLGAALVSSLAETGHLTQAASGSCRRGPRVRERDEGTHLGPSPPETSQALQGRTSPAAVSPTSESPRVSCHPPQMCPQETEAEGQDGDSKAVPLPHPRGLCLTCRKGTPASRGEEDGQGWHREAHVWSGPPDQVTSGPGGSPLGSGTHL